MRRKSNITPKRTQTKSARSGATKKRPAFDSGDGAPHYLALRDQLALRIEMGRLGVGSKLPSERDLQAETGAARGTIREALFQLQAEGLIYRRDRSGWYICPPAVTYDPTRWTDFTRYVSEQGRTPATETLAKAVTPATAALADIFRVAPGTPLYDITRRRAVDGRAVLMEHIIVDPALAPGLLEHSLDTSLTRLFENTYGVRSVRNRIDMRPCALVKEVADALSVKPGTPGLLLVRTGLMADGRVVEYDQEYWRHDAIRVHVDLRMNAPDGA